MASTPNKYKVTLELLKGDDSNTNGVKRAKDAAGWHTVMGNDGTALNENTHRDPKGSGSHSGKIYWHVYGKLGDVLAMCARWGGLPDADDNGNYQQGFTPTVKVIYPPQAE
jgi:hypothetical protein